MKDTAEHPHNTLQNPQNTRVGVVRSRYHSSITSSLEKGAIQAFQQHDIPDTNILTRIIPGTFELPQAASILLAQKEFLQGLVCIGVVIDGETSHAHYLNGSVANGIQRVAENAGKPITFGVLTCSTIEQARDRADDRRRGNKGKEAGKALMEMIALQTQDSSRHD